MTTRPGRRYAISITSDDGQTRQTVRLNTNPITVNDIEAQQRTSIEDNTYAAEPDEIVLNFIDVSYNVTQEIFQSFTKRELLQLLLIDNEQWQTCIYDAMHAHQNLSLFIGSEEEARNICYVFSDIFFDHLHPHSAESLLQRHEFLQFDQLDEHDCEWLVDTFPQIRVLEIQVIRPTFWSTPYVSALLSHYAHQLITVRLSFVHFNFLPFMLLQPISEMPALRHLTLHFPVGVWEYGENIIPDNPNDGFIQILPQVVEVGNQVIEVVPTMLRQIFERLETFHFNASTDPPMHRLLMECIGNDNRQLKEIILKIKGTGPNAAVIQNLPEAAKTKIVKLELCLSASTQFTPALLDPFTSLRVLSLQRTTLFSFENMLGPLARLSQLRHLMLQLWDWEVWWFQERLLNNQVVQDNLRSLPSITSMTLTLNTISHQVVGFPFHQVFTSVKWISFRWSKYHCATHPWANGDEARKACNKALLRPLAALPQLQKIYAVSSRYCPTPCDPNPAAYIQTTGDDVWYEWTAEELKV